MKSIIAILIVCCGSAALAQQPIRPEHALLVTSNLIAPDDAKPIYKIKPKVDFPVAAGAAGFTFWGFSKIYGKEATPEADIRALRKSNLNGVDRWAAGLHSEKAATTSDLFFYGSIPAPLLLLLDKDIRKDAPKIGLLYVEAMAITGVLYTGSAMLFDRYRPLTYSTEVPMEERVSGNNRNSFFAGHAALVGTATFFAAKVYSDYHPTSNVRYAVWGAAAAATGATAYLRHRGGKHFPTDLAVGTAIGTLSGILVPQFHKVKNVRAQRVTVLPFSGQSHGLAVLYKL